MSFDEDSYDIGDAQQFYGTVAPWAQDISPGTTGLDEFEQQALAQYYDQSDPYGSGSGWGQDTLSAMGVADDTNPASLSGLSKFFSRIGNAASKAGNFATSNQGIMALLAALAAYENRAGPSGGGATEGYGGPRQYNRTVDQGIVRYAANGGLMQAYAHGGAVRPFPMEDGGFVMTADAVKGANKMVDGGIASLLPDAKMIRGPGTGKSDDIPAVIHGPNGQTPARLSNGEAYVPPGRDTKGLYALMHKLERKA